MGPMRRTKQPEWVQPMLATLTRDYFSDPEWVFEPKLDGIRCIAFKKGSSVKLLSLNKLDLTHSYRKVADALAGHEGNFIIDGEVAAVQEDRTSFGLLQQARHGTVPIVYFVFDIVFIDGHDTTKLDLLERKALLKRSLARALGRALVEAQARRTEIAFAEWTGDGRLRHPRFVGLRRDKKAHSVVRESA